MNPGNSKTKQWKRSSFFFPLPPRWMRWLWRKSTWNYQMLTDLVICAEWAVSYFSSPAEFTNMEPGAAQLRPEQHPHPTSRDNRLGSVSREQQWPLSSQLVWEEAASGVRVCRVVHPEPFQGAPSASPPLFLFRCSIFTLLDMLPIFYDNKVAR